MNNLNSKTVVVTGASGYIGSMLINALRRYPYNIIRISRNELMPLVGTESIKADINKPRIWSEIVAQADVIYHLAGNTSVYDAAKNPSESLISSLLPLNHLIKAAQTQRRNPRTVFASTATVYGLTTNFPVAESAKPRPVTVYDMHKYFAEQQLFLAAQQGILENVSLRLSNVYGPSASVSSAADRGVLNKVTMMALRGKDLVIYGDGNYLRDYIYIDDVISAFILAGNSKDLGNNVFNVSNGKSITIDEAFKMVARKAAIITGKKVDIKYSPWPSGASKIECRSYVSDVSSISLNLGWQSTTKLESGIDRMIDWIRVGVKCS